MALSFLTRKKSTAGKGYVPTDRIRDLASKGFSEPEIIDILRKEDFSPGEVDKGLTQALKISVSPAQPQYEAPKPSAPPKPPELRPFTEQAEQPQLPELPTTLDELQKVQKPGKLEIPETSLPQEYYSSYSTEEYIDYLVSQRVTELYDRLQEVSDKYDDMNKKMDDIKGHLDKLGGNLSNQHSSLREIEEFKGIVSDVSARLGGLEKAFKDTLPSLIDSVRTLADLIQKSRKAQSS